MNKSNFTNRLFKCLLMFFLSLFLSISTACGNALSGKSDIYAEIQKYEWSDMYDHKETYEKSCEMLFCLLPARLKNGFFSESLIDSAGHENGIYLDLDCYFVPAYGGKYMNGIPMKNRNSYEECYEKTIEVLRTLHKEYIEMGIIQKKAE